MKFHFHSVILKATFAFFLLLFAVGCGSVSSSHENSTFNKHTEAAVFRIAFYNLENLFDTVDGPNEDSEFLPKSENQWNAERYASKLRNMSQVIDSIAPDILGVVEVENAFVLEDLRNASGVMRGKFKIAHRESPDIRGIDVGLMYNGLRFDLSGIYMIPVVLYDGYATRNIMRVHLIEKSSGDSLAVFVNHWPSRRGGEASAANRMTAALALTRNIESTPNLPSNYLLMGDFNDDPKDVSITQGLNAGDQYQPIVNMAYIARNNDSAIGSLAWHTGWNFFDQLMLSRALYYCNTHDKLSNATTNTAIASGSVIQSKTDGFALNAPKGFQMNVYKRSWMLQRGGKYDGWPLRTFAGKKYMNGYSDHLPVYIDLMLLHPH